MATAPAAFNVQVQIDSRDAADATNVDLSITYGILPRGDCISVKVTGEGIIIERWDGALGEYTHSRTFVADFARSRAKRKVKQHRAQRQG